MVSIKSLSRRLRVSDTSGVILDQTLSLDADKKELILFYGGKSSLAIGLLKNDLVEPASGKSRVRISSNAVGLGSYDIYFSLSTEDYHNQEPKVSSATSTTLDVDKGTYTIRFTTPGSKEVLFQMPPRTLDEKGLYNLVTYNEGSSLLPNAFWYVQDSTDPPEFLTNAVSRIRVVNAAQNIQSANFTVVGGSRLFAGIPFSGVTSYAVVPSGQGSYVFTDAISGALYSFSATLSGGHDYTALLAPQDAGGQLLPIVVADKTLPPSAGKARVRVVNGSLYDGLALSLSYTQVTSPAGARATSDYVEVSSGTGTPVTISQGSAAVPILSTTQDLTSGYTYSFVLAGSNSVVKLTIGQDR